MIYTQKPGEWKPPFGNTLGKMTNELEDFGADSHAVAFVGCGPKAYGLKIKNANGDFSTIVKVKGFNLNHNASQLINFERMREMMGLFLCGQCSPTAVNFPSIIRSDTHKVMTRNSIKEFKIVYTKRHVRSDGTTLPFGY